MIRLLTIILLFTCFTSIAHAEEGIIKKPLDYDVEIIIFEDPNARYINSENWPHDSVLADANLEQSADSEPTVSKPLEEATLSEADTAAFQNIKSVILNKEYKRINNSKEYNVLFYGSWRQTGLAAKDTFEIPLQELDNKHKTTSENTITGNFKLVLARYLHIYSTLNYQRKLTGKAGEQAVTNTANENIETAAPSIETTTLNNETYQINNHRRMRSKELHYIDHPLVGMLIQINPVKISAETTPEKPVAQ